MQMLCTAFSLAAPGADIVSRLFKEVRDAERALRMSVINWGEVYYTIAKVEGFSETARIINRAKLLPSRGARCREEVTAKAAQLKAGHGHLYPDCLRLPLPPPKTRFW